MKLIVGLGNPTKKYENTRHNMGFMVIDNYLDNRGIKEKYKEKFEALYLETNIHSEKVIFVKPLTYMNNSGIAVSKFVNFYKIAPKDILIVSDDLDLELGKFRLRPKGSSGGHNGLKSIISYLNTDEFKRLRVGISNNTDNIIDYVLSGFSKQEKEILEEEFLILNKVLDDYFVLDFQTLMSKYNRH
ncbi:MAG TPA: aminoacyl-tRNA hydrolase [Candidatus Onthousia faecavium]|nr:aminoacyl-tRNA hydrolase [Candidatus Onthousia faecavium]